MTSPSKPSSKLDEQQIIEQTTDALNQAVEHMPQSTSDELVKIRRNALAAKRKPTTSWQHKSWQVVLPIAATLVIVVSLTSQSPEQVPVLPELPLTMLSSDVPTEDLAMLEDLEFMTWLAENEATAFL